MSQRINTCSILGIDPFRVEVEAQIVKRQNDSAARRFSIVGLPDGVLRESKDRVRCAIENSGMSFPNGEVIVSLSPASLPKAGSGFDLAIAISILAAAGRLRRSALQKYLFFGELALDGKLRNTPGVISAASLAVSEKLELVIGDLSATIARSVPGVAIAPIRSLLDALNYLTNPEQFQSPNLPSVPHEAPRIPLDFRDVVGQHAAKRALEVVAAGAHNLLMVGPPGAGKSMLAQRLPSLLPPLTDEESLEVTKIYGMRAALGEGARSAESLIRLRPFRAPHHTSSVAGLIGGGTTPQPGEISLAHRGVLFLDELPEFRREALESMRQPLEDRCVVISRSALRVKFPAHFILVGAMNPCPCGKRGLGAGQCECSTNMLKRYNARLSGPLLDRIDLQVWVGAVPLSALRIGPEDNPSAGMMERVMRARAVQAKRFKSQTKTNASMSPSEVREHCALSGENSTFLERASTKLQLTARSYTRMLKLSRTIADLDGAAAIATPHIAEAISYRLEGESR